MVSPAFAIHACNTLPPSPSPLRAAHSTMLLGNELQLQRIELWGYANQPSANWSHCSCCCSGTKPHCIASHQHHQLHSGSVPHSVPAPQPHLCRAHNQHHQQTKNAFLANDQVSLALSLSLCNTTSSSRPWLHPPLTDVFFVSR